VSIIHIPNDLSTFETQFEMKQQDLHQSYLEQQQKLEILPPIESLLSQQQQTLRESILKANAEQQSVTSSMKNNNSKTSIVNNNDNNGSIAPPTQISHGKSRISELDFGWSTSPILTRNNNTLEFSICVSGLYHLFKCIEIHL
jgi:hypothetical protein